MALTGDYTIVNDLETDIFSGDEEQLPCVYDPFYDVNVGEKKKTKSRMTKKATPAAVKTLKNKPCPKKLRMITKKHDTLQHLQNKKISHEAERKNKVNNSNFTYMHTTDDVDPDVTLAKLTE